MPDNKLHGKQIKDKSINIDSQGFILNDYTFADLSNTPLFALSNKSVADYASASNGVLVNKAYLTDKVTYLEDLISQTVAGFEMYVVTNPNATTNVANLILTGIDIPDYKSGTDVEIELNGLTFFHKRASGLPPTVITEGECYFSNDGGANAVSPAEYVFDSNTTELYLAYTSYDIFGTPLVGFEIETIDTITIFYSKVI